jgi:hypothetical protein
MLHSWNSLLLVLHSLRYHNVNLANLEGEYLYIVAVNNEPMNVTN